MKPKGSIRVQSRGGGMLSEVNGFFHMDIPKEG
jgi:hypothetical protein